MLNYEIKLLKKETEKHSEICIVIPTFKSKEVTLKTILLLISNNKNILYDILLVDNEGFDYEYIKQNVKNSKFQNLNHIVLQNNIGSAGSYYAGQKYAYDLGYKYFILTDNDANLIQKEGISMLINSLNQYDVVIPTNISSIQKDTKENTKINFEGELHFLTLSKKTIEKLGFVNKNYFWTMDDLDYIARANSLNLKVYRIKKCLYYHTYRKISLFYNLTVYFTVRNNFLFIFKNPNYVAIKYKFRSFKYLVSYLLVKILHFLKLKDISLLKTIFLAFRDFCCNLITLKLPNNNFEFIEVELTDKDQKNHFFDIDLDKNRVLIKNQYFSKNKRYGLINYFVLKRY